MVIVSWIMSMMGLNKVLLGGTKYKWTGIHTYIHTHTIYICMYVYICMHIIYIYI